MFVRIKNLPEPRFYKEVVIATGKIAFLSSFVENEHHDSIHHYAIVPIEGTMIHITKHQYHKLIDLLKDSKVQQDIFVDLED